MEKWVELKYDNIESCYMISNAGKIKTKTKSKFIDVYHSTNGFDYVMLLKNINNLYPAPNVKMIRIDKLVVKSFSNINSTNFEVIHIDGDNRNNDFNNLKVVDIVEIWRDVTCMNIQPNVYQVSNNGKVRYVSGIEKPVCVNGGYAKTFFRLLNKHGRNIGIHKIVYLTFNNLKDTDGLQINHIDGDKLNNELYNLEMVTPKQNTNHAHLTGLSKDGAYHYNVILSEKCVRRICELLVCDKIRGRTDEVLSIILDEFPTINITRDIVSSIKHKSSWNNISDEYFDKAFFKNQMRYIVKTIWESAKLNFANTHNVFVHLNESGFVYRFNLNKNFIFGVINKYSLIEISDEYFTIEQVNELREMKIKLICDELINSEMNCKRAYEILKNKIPYLKLSYVFDVKRHRILTEIVDKYLKKED